MRYKAIFFDVGNTLLYPYPSVGAVCAEVLASHGYNVPLDRLAEALSRADEYYEEKYREDDTFWLTEERAISLWMDLYALVMVKVGLSAEPHLSAGGGGGESEASRMAREIYDEFGHSERWRTYPDVLPVLRELKERGFILGIISNWDTRLPSLCVELGFSSLLSFVIASAAVGSLKPQLRIFELGLRRAGVGASEAIHVGDHYYADVMGARCAGITPILIDREKRGIKSDCPVIESLDELLSCNLLRTG
ncbi:MAG: HAD-IA family hydrolase [Actinomycetota bacterium]|nr:HAD-IA family hydrolase [Actinomycetota bacterium]